MTQNCNCHGSGDQYSRTVSAVLERPRYSPGLMLEDSDLGSAVEYTRSLSRLLFRNLFGCGIVCGLLVTVKQEGGLTVTVAPGLALDSCGDPVEVPAPIAITLDKTQLANLFKPPKKPEFWVVLCGGEKMCAPRALVCESDEYDGVTQATRIRSLAQVSLAFERPECVCECGPRTEPIVQFVNAAPVDDEVDCHSDHETRVECAPDCGCGTACACGCCLLLAHVRLQQYPGGVVEWIARNRGVRRFIRPRLLPDPAERRENWTGRDSTTTDVYWGIDDSHIVDGVKEKFPWVRPGDRLTGEQVSQVIDHIRREKFTAEQWASEFGPALGTVVVSPGVAAAPETDADSVKPLATDSATTSASEPPGGKAAKTGAKAKARSASDAADKPAEDGEAAGTGKPADKPQ